MESFDFNCRCAVGIYRVMAVVKSCLCRCS